MWNVIRDFVLKFLCAVLVLFVLVWQSTRAEGVYHIIHVEELVACSMDGATAVATSFEDGGMDQIGVVMQVLQSANVCTSFTGHVVVVEDVDVRMYGTYVLIVQAAYLVEDERMSYIFKRKEAT